MSFAYRFNQILTGSLDWLFPPICGGCRRVGFRWCPECQQQVKGLPEPVCQFCGLPVERTGSCNICYNTPPPYKAMRSWLIFEGPIRHALHTLKYRRNVSLGDSLAQCLAKYVASLDWQVDVVVPVPLGRHRMRERGYNQVGLVAMPLALMHGWRYMPQVLSRIAETRSQVGLTALERRQNVAGAFGADPSLASGRSVLLMDDVATTGATVASCAEALLAAGANSVYILTLARALPHHGLSVA